MKALIDADILRYEIGFGAETGIRDLVEGSDKYPDLRPSMSYVELLLTQKVMHIMEAADSKDFCLYLTSDEEGFRKKIATIAPYKGNREDKRPYHYENMTNYIRENLPHKMSEQGLEADDMLAIDQITALKEGNENTVICSRDKDLLQVPGYHYGWPMGKQGESPMNFVGGTDIGYASVNSYSWGKKLIGWGLKFFYAQCLTGDSTDNIKGLPKVGPVKALEILNSATTTSYLFAVMDAYEKVYGEEHGYDYFLENARLLWLVRRYNADGTPEMYQPGEMPEELYHGQTL